LRKICDAAKTVMTPIHPMTVHPMTDDESVRRVTTEAISLYPRM
jgi:hypothetical protein